MRTRLLVATGNRHKAGEIREILGEAWVVEDLRDHPDIVSAEETGCTFGDNAALKAVAASGTYPGIVLADDSGLEVDALQGRPGVRSARYAGEAATDAENRTLLLKELDGVPPEQRSARFRCAIAIARGGELLAACDGAVEGMILAVERGEGGFGYDSLFVPDGHELTFAELPGDLKNRESHRARAMKEAAKLLASIARRVG